MKAITNLSTGEHKVSVYSLKLQDQEGQPFFSLVLVNEAGEQVTVSTKLDAFGIHQSMQLVNNLIDDFNLLLLDGKEDYNGEPLPLMPLNGFSSFCHYGMVLEALEEALKEFEAVLKINIRTKYQTANGTESKRLEYLEMEKISA